MYKYLDMAATFIIYRTGTVCNVCSMNMQLLISLVVLVSGATCLPPHVVLLLADDLGWNDVSWHNQVQC